MGEQEEQKVLMAELAEQSALFVDKVGHFAPGYDRQGVAACEKPSIDTGTLDGCPVAIIAVGLLELCQMFFHIWDFIGCVGAISQGEPHRVSTGQTANVIHGHVGHAWHPVVLDLPESQRSLAVAGMGNERGEQLLPVCGDARRSSFTNERDKTLPILIVRAADDLPFST